MAENTTLFADADPLYTTASLITNTPTDDADTWTGVALSISRTVTLSFGATTLEIYLHLQVVKMGDTPK